MWLFIGIMILLLMLPMAFAAVVYLLASAVRFVEALARGTAGALRKTWAAAVWAYRAARWALHKGCSLALRLRDWHHAGSTWAGQFLQASWLAWSNAARRRYIAGALRRRRRERVRS